jgi:hypothetical protein
MTTKTNSLGQPITDTGHVLTATEVVYAELDAMPALSRKLTKKELTALTEWVTQREYDLYFKYYKQGIVAGRREGEAIQESKKEAKK